MPRLWIDQLSFSDGSAVTLAKDDIVLVVGPNNSGKSATLRAIRDKLAANTASPVISNLTSVREGTPEDVTEWLESFTKKNDPFATDPIFQGLGGSVHRSQINHFWNAQQPLHGLARFFCHLLTADERLQAANPPGNIAVLRDPPTHPIHYLIRDEQLEKRLSDHFKKAFGEDLIANRLAGNQVPLHVGLRPVPTTGQDRLSLEYVQELEKLPLLHTQGDGMRSFAGVLLYTSVGRESILLIDEPEAFLHPPQARQLGRMLVTNKPEERQVFVATHSGDVLRGVLDAGTSNVRVIRVRRVGNVNHVRQIDNAKLAELWNDPLLRYSNILDGLFHEKVIICEGDADARFYAAVADSIVEARGQDAARPDVMFTHCGGKDRCALVIRALRAVDVPIVAVLDFDVLNAEFPLRDIVEAAGGDWQAVAADWTLIKSAIESKKPELTAAEVRSEIELVLAPVAGTIAFPREAKESIQKLFKRASPWATAKAVGKPFVPAGQPTQAFDRLMTTLRGYGIYVVEVGEVESFVRSVGNHGPKWVNEAIKKNLQADTELDAARKFVSHIIESEVGS
jgi:energy-coupling factor transporter ATP-binding protein EcfA2